MGWAANLFEITEEHKDGRRKCGFFVRWKNTGEPSYVALKKQSEMIVKAEKNTSEALRNDSAYWGIDYEILSRLEREGAKYVCILVKPIDDLYVARLSSFFDHRVACAHQGRKKRLEKMIPVSAFQVRRSLNSQQ